MSSMWGKNIKISIFGESHGDAIGVTIDGLPSGFMLDLDAVAVQMQRRAPGNDDFSTARKEADIPRIISGFYNGHTTGTPLCAMIENTDTKSHDYTKLQHNMRPGHADYTGFLRYNGFNDPRGGGHFSGRLTAPLVFAGAVCRQILQARGVNIGAHILSIGDKYDTAFDMVNINKNMLIELQQKPFTVINEKAAQAMKQEIITAKQQKNSVGGIVECAVIGLPAGVGSPIFDTVESTLASILFAIPAVKGVEFGSGFKISTMTGAQANDALYVNENGRVSSFTNNNGGIIGGITNGMPIIFKVAFKPTPSIAAKQQTVNIDTMENTTIEVQGRHDPCIVQRAVVVVEAAAAVCMLDLFLGD